ncbi:DUF5719 family protein [Cellulosimicrobium sp. Marseille-Q8652]
MTGPRHVLGRLARTGAGVVGIVAVGAVAAFGGALTERVPELAVADPVQHVTVAPAQDLLVCPGPARLTDPEAVGDAQFAPAPVGTSSVLRTAVQGVATSTLTPLDGGAGAELDATADAVGPVSTTVEDPTVGSVLAVRPGEGDPPRSAASVGSSTSAGDLRGLAAASCGRPGVSQWLVGGSTEIGSSAQLVLQNPGLTPATVQVSVWGQGGQAVLAGGGQQLVGPGEEVVTLVEAAAPEQRRLVVHVEASGGLVSAYLQHTTLDGLVPLGLDYVVPGAEPAHDLAVTGLASVGEAVDDPHAPRLRVLAPGPDPGTARVVVHGADGVVPLRGVEEVALTPGVVTDVSLGGLPAGRYTVAVHADVPVVAGGSVDRRGEPDPDLLHEERQYDRAWVAAVPLVEPDAASGPVRAGQVALVPGTSSSLSLAAVPLDGEGNEAASGELGLVVRAYGADGALLGEKSVAVAAGTTATLAPESLRPKGSDEAPASVTVDVDQGADGLVPLWSVLASAGPPSGEKGDRTPSLLSVLLPVGDGSAPREVAVRATGTAGLGG